MEQWNEFEECCKLMCIRYNQVIDFCVYTDYMPKNDFYHLSEDVRVGSSEIYWSES